MAKKPTRARTARRIESRRYAGLVRDQERAARLAPGGNPAQPLVATSAAVIEPSARALPCPLCGGAFRVEEHAAEAGLRIVHVVCARCGVRRPLYFRIDAVN